MKGLGAVLGTMVCILCWIVGVGLTLTGIGAIIGIPLIIGGMLIGGAGVGNLLESKAPKPSNGPDTTWEQRMSRDY